MTNIPARHDSAVWTIKNYNVDLIRHKLRTNLANPRSFTEYWQIHINNEVRDTCKNEEETRGWLKGYFKALRVSPKQIDLHQAIEDLIKTARRNTTTMPPQFPSPTGSCP